MNAPRHISIFKITIQNQHQNKSAAELKSSAEMYEIDHDRKNI